MFRTWHDYLKYSFWCKPEYEEILDNQIKNSDLLIVGLTWCPWTFRAKSLFKNEYEDYFSNLTVLPADINSNEFKVNLLYCLCKKTQTVYVPQIWVKGKHIGGFEELWKMHHRGQIKSVLENNINKTL